MKKLHILATGLAALVITHSASAAPRIAFSGKVGTLGYGAEVTCGLSRKINLRAGFNPGPSYNYAFTADETEYDLSLKFRALSGLVDWYPSGGTFRLSTGVVANRSETSGSAHSTGVFAIGDQLYTGEDIGELSMGIPFPEVAPYLGLGWGNGVGPGNRFGVVFDAGVLVGGSPKVQLSASGPFANDEILKRNLAMEEESVSSKFRMLRVYPV